MSHLQHLTSRSGGLATAATLVAALCLTGTVSLAAPALAAPGLTVNDSYRPTASIGFRDITADGSPRTLRDDLVGTLRGEVDLVQATSSAPSGNAAREMPTIVAERVTLLTMTPRTPTTSLAVEVRVRGELKGTLDLAPPALIPAADQDFGSRPSVAYSLRAWSGELPYQWVLPGLTLTFVDADGARGTVESVEVGAPTEIVVNNIQLGMLTAPPKSSNHRFINDPADGATDYFQTLPVARMTMASYEPVSLDKVIIANGTIYSTDTGSAGEGGVYAGDMRENVGKAQVSTGINLATWGITSSPMNQRQPGHTNQRVIHHSAGLYTNGVVNHGLSGGNGMATLYSSVGNELSHELGHSYGLGHYPGRNTKLDGDDVIRNAVHHLESGWGYIPYRGLMRSNLSMGAFQSPRHIDGHPFYENLAGEYNFNSDTMSGGWDASPVSDYTHVTGYSLKRIQSSLRTLVADTSYPSGYRAWDAKAGAWVDAKVADPAFALPRPEHVGVPVFTILGGYNPADAAQTLVYPAFRSNYGVTFELPQADTTSTSSDRACWLEVTFEDAPTQHITLDASNGVKQLNVNIPEADAPTGARVMCRQDGTTTSMGAPISIATGLDPLTPPVVVGQETGFDALRAQELALLEPRLEALSGTAAPVLTASDALRLRGWSDDLSQLSTAARAVAERFLALEADAVDVTAHLAERADTGTVDASELSAFLRGKGYTDSSDHVLPAGDVVTVDGGKCLTFEAGADGTTTVRATLTAADCTGSTAEQWWVDVAGRIHPVDAPELCLGAGTPVRAVRCSTTDVSQRWVLQEDGHVVRQNATSSALDLYRSTHTPGLYGRANGSNQIWKGLRTSPNPLLAVLDATGLELLFGARGTAVSLLASTLAGDTGWHTAETSVAVHAGDALELSRGLPAEIKVGDVDAWSSYSDPVVLPEGTTTLAARSVDANGDVVSVSGEFRLDTVAPSSRVTNRDTTTRVTLAASDATSGVASIEYRIGSAGAWQTYTGSVHVPAAPGVLSYRATDVAGNVSPAAVVSTGPLSLPGGGGTNLGEVPVRPGDGPSTGTPATGGGSGSDVPSSPSTGEGAEAVEAGPDRTVPKSGGATAVRAGSDVASPRGEGAATDALPVTGGELSRPLLVAALLLLLGAAFMVVRRRTV